GASLRVKRQDGREQTCKADQEAKFHTVVLTERRGKMAADVTANCAILPDDFAVTSDLRPWRHQKVSRIVYESKGKSTHISSWCRRLACTSKRAGEPPAPRDRETLTVRLTLRTLLSYLDDTL